MISNRIISCIFFLAVVINVTGQDLHVLTERPGTFEILSRADYASPECGFTKADMTAGLERIKDIVAIVRQNPVLNPLGGCNAIVSMSGNLCDDNRHSFYYGIMSSIYFAFYYFYMQNGELKQATGWSAHGTGININNPVNNIGRIFDESGFKTGDPPALKKPLEEALTNLKQFYITNPIEREISPGVKLFKGGYILVFNPDHPWIWKPVTVKEIMETELAYFKVKKEIDSINYEKTLQQWTKLNFKPPAMANTSVYDILIKEYRAFSSEELNKPAFLGSQDGSISGIRADGERSPVMKFNAECWDRILPPTAVQFISLDYKPASEEELQQFVKRNGGLTGYVGLYKNSLPVEKLSALINRK